MTARRLVAAIACRNAGSRLYGKPLQNLDIERGVRILDNLVECLRTLPCVDEIVLGISEGVENLVFQEVAAQHDLRYVVGDQTDVLSRLIQCGTLAAATDMFRVTSESPFPCFELVEDAWRRHQVEGADATLVHDIIDGSGFEILTLEALHRSHDRGTARHRSELCSLFIRENPDQFRIVEIEPPEVVRRSDIRLTVDYPEDLVVCRAVYMALRHTAPRVSVAAAVEFLDQHPALLKLIAPHTETAISAAPVRQPPVAPQNANASRSSE